MTTSIDDSIRNAALGWTARTTENLGWESYKSPRHPVLGILLVTRQPSGVWFAWSEGAGQGMKPAKIYSGADLCNWMDSLLIAKAA
jgi:hypothetical protein